MCIYLGCNCSLEAQYPANTNVLYVDLASVEKIASSQSADSLPGMIMNLKKPTVYLDGDGGKHRLFSKLSGIFCLLILISGLLFARVLACYTTWYKGIYLVDLETIIMFDVKLKVHPCIEQCSRWKD